eukprot:EG_transcript_18427
MGYVWYGMLAPLCWFGSLAPELCARFRVDIEAHQQRFARVAAFLAGLDLVEALYRCRALWVQRRSLLLKDLGAPKLEIRPLNKALEAALLKLLKQCIAFIQAVQAADVRLYGRRTEAMLAVTLVVLDGYHWCIAAGEE